jgi:hypothetical protein
VYCALCGQQRTLADRSSGAIHLDAIGEYTFRRRPSKGCDLSFVKPTD